MLRSHPADATQIQRVAVPTPNNGILLKRFFTAVAVVKEFYTKGNQSSELFAVSSTPRSLPAYIKKHPTIAPPFSEIARPSIKDHRSGAMEATPLLNSEIGECEYANRFFSLFALNDGHAASATNQTMPSCKQCAEIMNSIRGERKEPLHFPNRSQRPLCVVVLSDVLPLSSGGPFRQ